MTRIYQAVSLYKEVWGKLKRIRQSKGLSQEKLANELGFSQPHIVKIELGQLNTSISHLSAIAKALKIKPEELLQF